MDNEIAELKHRLQAAEAVARSLGQTLDEECKNRDASEARLAASLSAVADKLDTIVGVLMGNIKVPEVPGLVNRMAELKTGQASNAAALLEIRTQHTAALAEIKALSLTVKKELDDYRTAMPTPAECAQLKASSELHSSRTTYVMGWLGGSAAILFLLWQVVEMFSSKLKP